MRHLYTSTIPHTNYGRGYFNIIKTFSGFSFYLSKQGTEKYITKLIELPTQNILVFYVTKLKLLISTKYKFSKLT